MALKSSNEMLENASELNVLASLEAHDAAARSVRIHQGLLEQVGKLPSLLQISAANTFSPKNTHEVLESLMASLTDLSHEQNESEASLKVRFEQEFNVGTKKHQSLAEDQANLNNTIADREALRERLRAAVDHLQAQRYRLLEGIRSLRNYVKKMGDTQESNKTLVSFEQQEAHESQTAVPETKRETSKAVSKVDQQKQKRQAKPRKSSFLQKRQAKPRKDHGQGTRKRLNNDKGSKRMKHAKIFISAKKASETTKGPRTRNKEA